MLLLSFHVLIASVFVITTLSSQESRAAIIDFNDIADGTPVSTGNPYGGVVNLQARSGSLNIVSFPPLVGQTDYVEATIQNGAIQILSSVPQAEMYLSEFTATFLEPVQDVGFDAATLRHAVYTYVAANSSGAEITGSGLTADDFSGAYHHFTITVPAGYYVTQLQLNNRDPGAGGAAIWIDNLAFQVVGVPDCGSTALLAFFGLILVGVGSGAIRHGIPTE
jgi:hypothetical protein